MEILTLGEKIKRKRKELNMTLKDLAKDRITPGQISLVESGRSNPSMDLLEYLADNLDTTVEYLMESEESQAEKITTYYENLAQSYILRREYDNARIFLDKMREYSSKYDLEYRKGRLLFLEAIILEHNEKYEEAEQNYLSANVMFIKNNKYEDVVNTFLSLAKITIKSKSYYSANSYLKQAERAYLDNNIGNDVILGEIYYCMAKVYYSLENTEQALKYASISEKRFEGVYDKEKYSESLIKIAKNYSEDSNLEKAILYSSKAVKIQKQVSDDNCIGEVENDLGELFYNLNRIQSSYFHYDKSRKIKIVNKNRDLNKTLINICKNYIKEKEIDKCETLLNEVYTSLEADNKIDRINCDLIKYRILCIKERKIEAENLLIDIYNYAKKSQIYDRVAELCIMIAKFYSENKKDDLAKKYLNEAVEIYKSESIID